MFWQQVHHIPNINILLPYHNAFSSKADAISSTSALCVNLKVFCLVSSSGAKSQLSRPVGLWGQRRARRRTRRTTANKTDWGTITFKAALLHPPLTGPRSRFSLHFPAEVCYGCTFLCERWARCHAAGAQPLLISKIHVSPPAHLLTCHPAPHFSGSTGVSPWIRWRSYSTDSVRAYHVLQAWMWLINFYLGLWRHPLSVCLMVPPSK